MRVKIPKRRKAWKVILIIGIVLVVLFCGLSLVVGNLLFDFALNPNASVGMGDLFAQGEVPEATGGEPSEEEIPEVTKKWDAYASAAGNWFQTEGQPCKLNCADGTTRSGSYFANDSHLYAIVCHGYLGNSAQMAGYAKAFYDMGMNVLAPDALAHGKSDGEYIGMGWLERADVLAWIDSVIENDPEAQIMLFGVSMGGATVMMASGEDLPDNVKCIVEDCGYSSVMDEFSVQIEQLFGLPKFPLLYSANLICRIRAGYGFNEASAVKQLQQAEVPMLFIHGEEDTFVPYEMLDVVYEACSSPVKEKLSIPGAIHGVAAWADPVCYWNSIRDFVNRFMG